MSCIVIVGQRLFSWRISSRRARLTLFLYSVSTHLKIRASLHPLSGADPLLLVLYPTKQGCVLAVPWADVVYATNKKNTPNLPVEQSILQFFHSSREANKIAFVVSSRGDRNTRIGQGLRLRPSFFRLLLPLLIAAVAGHVLKPWLQLQSHSWDSTASCCSACGFQATHCPVQSSSQTALQFCIPCFHRDTTESSC